MDAMETKRVGMVGQVGHLTLAFAFIIRWNGKELEEGGHFPTTIYLDSVI